MALGCSNHPAIESGLAKCEGCARSFCGDCLVTIQGQRLCASCKAEHVRDVKSGTGGKPELASIGRRFAAVFIDGLILVLPHLAVVFLLQGGIMPQGGFVRQTLIGMLAGLLYVVYEGVLLSRDGQTLGKKALKIRVTTPEGGPIDARQAWTRSVVRWLFTSYVAIVNYLAVFFGGEKATIHDRIAHTRVMRAEE